MLYSGRVRLWQRYALGECRLDGRKSSQRQAPVVAPAARRNRLRVIPANLAGRSSESATWVARNALPATSYQDLGDDGKMIGREPRDAR